MADGVCGCGNLTIEPLGICLMCQAKARTPENEIELGVITLEDILRVNNRRKLMSMDPLRIPKAIDKEIGMADKRLCIKCNETPQQFMKLCGKCFKQQNGVSVQEFRKNNKPIKKKSKTIAASNPPAASIKAAAKPSAPPTTPSPSEHVDSEVEEYQVSAEGLAKLKAAAKTNFRSSALQIVSIVDAMEVDNDQ